MHIACVERRALWMRLHLWRNRRLSKLGRVGQFMVEIEKYHTYKPWLGVPICVVVVVVAARYGEW